MALRKAPEAEAAVEPDAVAEVAYIDGWTKTAVEPDPDPAA